MQTTTRIVRRRGLRTRIAAAFRRMAGGVDTKVAYARTVQFYRSTGKPVPGF